MAAFSHRVVPLPNQQVSLIAHGRERTRWHFGDSYPRPFFYPLTGPSGNCLTRVGHPGAPNHDHHRSVWFAHEKVLGINFWSDLAGTKIRQLEWLSYQDGDNSAIMAVRLGWFDGHDPAALLEQELIVSVSDESASGETLLELQATFTPKSDSIEFGKSNFGFFAVRVARELSSYFGGGRIVDSRGRVNEPAIFGKAAEWMDYSGSVQADTVEGITYFDHPSNPTFPSKWHVREDGWMGASVCRDRSIVTSKQKPLTLRYMLHVHRGDVDKTRAGQIAQDFYGRSRFHVRRSDRKHYQFETERIS